MSDTNKSHKLLGAVDKICWRDAKTAFGNGYNKVRVNCHSVQSAIGKRDVHAKYCALFQSEATA
ncbi:MAG: hypothetical protein IJ774_12935 [Selenomonadaceae bacterium]|nr:hypothetical protein [Selenomonadaceae bacterium]